MAGNSHLDLLIAEMLGDVGKLHDEIRLLKDEALPAIVTDAERKLSGVVGTLVAAGENYRAFLKDATTDVVKMSKSDLKLSAEELKIDILAGVRQGVREAVHQPIVDLVRDLKSATDKANGQRGNTLMNTMIVAVVAAVGGGVASALLMHAMHW